MHRRTFLQRSSLLALTVPLWGCGGEGGESGDIAADSAASGGTGADPRMARIGITTVCLRSRFPRTRAMGEPTTASDLDLLTAPKYIADTFGIHNVEVWDLHFEDQSIAFCERARAAAAEVGSKFINIQIDSMADLSVPDAATRAQGVTQAKQWMDRAVALGAPSIRVNTGGSEGQTMDLDVIVDSFKQIAAYGQQVGVTVLVENHTGFSIDVDTVVAIVDAVNHPMCRTLLDYGNTPAGSIEGRIEAIQKLAPKLALVSAKGTGFDDQYVHTDYDFGALVKATEDTGYRGIYSIEMWPDADSQAPADPVAAATWMRDQILANLRPA